MKVHSILWFNTLILSLYFKYMGCIKWIYYEVLIWQIKYIFTCIIITCTCIHFPGLYFLPEMWKLRLIRKTDFEIFFWEREREQENMDFIEILSFKLPCYIQYVIIYKLTVYFFKFHDWREAMHLLLSNFLMALPYVAARSTCWHVAKWINFLLI